LRYIPTEEVQDYEYDGTFMYFYDESHRGCTATFPTYTYPKWVKGNIVVCKTFPYKYATHYSYDIEGNVQTVVQDIPALSPVNNRYKRIDYDYDLVSGKVNDVYYEKDSIDEFIQQYQYDNDLRLTDVLSSTDSVDWDEDAEYNYYNHGPLARMELGRLQVQGVDYAYTINGWLKGINSTSGLPATDMGTDGLDLQGHNDIGQDAFGEVLNYYPHDYRAISTTTNSLFESKDTSSDFRNGSAGLYNGNIKSAAYFIEGLSPRRIGYDYSYDQLNRLTAMVAFQNYNKVEYAAISGRKSRVNKMMDTPDCLMPVN
jgi:hypothetical protein